MLYKVTPLMAPPEKAAKKPRQPGEPRKKRKSAVYDHEGREVLITLMCLKCRQVKPLAQFGLRRMADGAIRNQPWCRPCRSGAGVSRPRDERAPEAAAASEEAEVEASVEVQEPAALPPGELASGMVEAPADPPDSGERPPSADPPGAQAP